jgi:putative addiction module killer protein
MSEGNFGDTRPVGDGVSELRFSFGPGYRIYYTRRQNDGTLIILLAGGDKGDGTFPWQNSWRQNC